MAINNAYKQLSYIISSSPLSISQWPTTAWAHTHTHDDKGDLRVRAFLTVWASSRDSPIHIIWFNSECFNVNKKDDSFFLPFLDVSCLLTLCVQNTDWGSCFLTCTSPAGRTITDPDVIVYYKVRSAKMELQHNVCELSQSCFFSSPTHWPLSNFWRGDHCSCPESLGVKNNTKRVSKQVAEQSLRVRSKQNPWLGYLSVL